MTKRIILATLLMALALPTAKAGGLTAVDDAADEPVKRIATLDFITTEIVALLGRDPVAVAGLADYREWVDVANGSVSQSRDLGRRTEPDREILAASQPDLITGATFRHQPLVDGLRRIAPVVLYNWLPSDKSVNPLDHLRQQVRHLGQRIGRAERAETVLSTMNRALAQQAERLDQADWANQPVLLAQHVRGTDRFNLYTEHSLASAIAREIGLATAWDGDADEFGYQTVGVRTLLELKSAHMLLIAQPDDRAFQQLSQSALWQSVPAVEAGRVHRLPPKTWFFGGPKTVSRLARQFTDALLTD
jgi:iron complex transport system substrate-binding protein